MPTELTTVVVPFENGQPRPLPFDQFRKLDWADVTALGLPGLFLNVAEGVLREVQANRDGLLLRGCFCHTLTLPDKSRSGKAG